MAKRRSANPKGDGASVYVGIVGLGYVGLPLAREFCKGGAKVLGFDVNSKAVATINRGRSPIKHIPHATMSEMIRSGQFEATEDMRQLSKPDAILICVPTPLTKNREPDLQYVETT